MLGVCNSLSKLPSIYFWHIRHIWHIMRSILVMCSFYPGFTVWTDPPRGWESRNWGDISRSPLEQRLPSCVCDVLLVSDSWIRLHMHLLYWSPPYVSLLTYIRGQSRWFPVSFSGWMQRNELIPTDRCSYAHVALAAAWIATARAMTGVYRAMAGVYRKQLDQLIFLTSYYIHVGYDIFCWS